MQETLCVGVLFNEVADINLRPLVKTALYQGGLPVNLLELSALLHEGLTWAPLFWKNWELCTTGLQNVLFKTASFQHIFQKQSVVSSLYSKVAGWRL